MDLFGSDSDEEQPREEQPEAEEEPREAPTSAADKRKKMMELASRKRKEQVCRLEARAGASWRAGWGAHSGTGSALGARWSGACVWNRPQAARCKPPAGGGGRGGGARQGQGGQKGAQGAGRARHRLWRQRG